ncbi:MAG: hypothetical protein U0174_28755 [Polyangiaceae bacterium]
MSDPKLIRTPLLIVGSWLALVVAGAVVLLVVSFVSKPGGSSTDKDIKSSSPASSSTGKGTRT